MNQFKHAQQLNWFCFPGTHLLSTVNHFIVKLATYYSQSETDLWKLRPFPWILMSALLVCRFFCQLLLQGIFFSSWYKLSVASWTVQKKQRKEKRPCKVNSIQLSAHTHTFYQNIRHLTHSQTYRDKLGSLVTQLSHTQVICANTHTHQLATERVKWKSLPWATNNKKLINIQHPERNPSLVLPLCSFSHFLIDSLYPLLFVFQPPSVDAMLSHERENEIKEQYACTQTSTTIFVRTGVTLSEWGNVANVMTCSRVQEFVSNSGKARLG